MRERMQTQLATLRQELQVGQARLSELERTVWRIQGAILVLEELLAAQPEEERPAMAAGGNGQNAVEAAVVGSGQAASGPQSPSRQREVPATG